MTDGVAVQEEEEEVIDGGVHGYAPALGGFYPTVTLGCMEITKLQFMNTKLQCIEL